MTCVTQSKQCLPLYSIVTKTCFPSQTEVRINETGLQGEPIPFQKEGNTAHPAA